MPDIVRNHSEEEKNIKAEAQDWLNGQNRVSSSFRTD
jgi:hypothetical protein